MGVLAGPALVIFPGLLMLLWSIVAVRRATASARWPRVEGRIVSHERDAHGAVDVVEYPLPDGGQHQVRPQAHGRYESGRPLGSSVVVWRDPVDALDAALEAPALERFAGQLLVGILGGFFLVAGIVWAILIVALVSR